MTLNDLKEKAREILVDALLVESLKSLTNDFHFRKQVLLNGSKGYLNMTNAEILAAARGADLIESFSADKMCLLAADILSVEE